VSLNIGKAQANGSGFTVSGRQRLKVWVTTLGWTCVLAAGGKGN